MHADLISAVVLSQWLDFSRHLSVASPQSHCIHNCWAQVGWKSARSHAF